MTNVNDIETVLTSWQERACVNSRKINWNKESKPLALSDSLKNFFLMIAHKKRR